MRLQQPQRPPSPLPRTKDPPERPKQQNRPFRTKPTTWKSYAQAAATQLISPEKLILNRNERDTTPDSTTESVWTPQDSHYRPLKRGTEPNSVFYDVTDLGNCPDEFYSALNGILTSEQNLGAKYHRENKRILIEIICDSNITCQTLVDTGVKIKDSVITPVKSLDQEAEVVTVMLSNLPFIHKLDLQQGLMTILSSYGQVLDVLLFTDPKSGFFFGNGMAVLNKTPPASVRALPDYKPEVSFYAPLTHNIDFMGKRRFHATWQNMPSFCIYCHDPEHMVKDCPERPVLKCWKCGLEGHVKSRCNNDKHNTGRKKPKTHHRQEEVEDFSDNEQFDLEALNLTEEAEKQHKTLEITSTSPKHTGRRNSEASLLSISSEDEHSEPDTQKENDDMEVDDEDNDESPQNDNTGSPIGPLNSQNPVLDPKDNLNQNQGGTGITKEPTKTKGKQLQTQLPRQSARLQEKAARAEQQRREKATLDEQRSNRQVAHNTQLSSEQAMIAEQQRLAQALLAEQYRQAQAQNQGLPDTLSGYTPPAQH